MNWVVGAGSTSDGLFLQITEPSRMSESMFDDRYAPKSGLPVSGIESGGYLGRTFLSTSQGPTRAFLIAFCCPISRGAQSLKQVK